MTTAKPGKVFHEKWCFTHISGSLLELYIHTICTWSSQQCALYLCCPVPNFYFYTFMLHSQFFLSFGDQIKWVISSALVLFTYSISPWQKSSSVSQIFLLTWSTSYVRYWWCASHTPSIKATAEKESNSCNVIVSMACHSYPPWHSTKKQFFMTNEIRITRATKQTKDNVRAKTSLHLLHGEEVFVF